MAWYDLPVPKWLHPWLGTSDGVSAIATAIASIIAFVTLIYLAVQQRDIRQEQRRQAAERLAVEGAARRAQAALVHIWAEEIQIPTGISNPDQLRGPPSVFPGSHPMSRGVRVRNPSEAPVYDLTIVFLDPGGAGQVVKRVGVVGPGSEQHVAAPSTIRHDVDHMKAAVTFVDSSSQPWWRGHRGLLNEGPYPHPLDGPLVPWE